MEAKQYIRMSKAVEGFVALRRATVSPVTAKNEAFIIRRFAAYLGEDIQLRHLRREQVTDWFYGPHGVMSEHKTRDGRSRPPIHASTHNHYRTRLQAFFLYCQRRGYISDDLLLDVPIKKFVRRQRFQPKPDVLMALLDHARDPRDRVYLAIAINTALRQGDIRSLRVGDLDLDGGWLNVIIAKTSEMYLGLSSERKRRDDLMRGKPFLSAMVDTSNVVRLRAAT